MILVICCLMFRTSGWLLPFWRWLKLGQDIHTSQQWDCAGCQLSVNCHRLSSPLIMSCGAMNMRIRSCSGWGGLNLWQEFHPDLCLASCYSHVQLGGGLSQTKRDDISPLNFWVSFHKSCLAFFQRFLPPHTKSGQSDGKRLTKRRKTKLMSPKQNIQMI